MSDNYYSAEEIKALVTERYNEILDEAQSEAEQYVIDIYGLTTEQVWDALDGIEPTYDDEYDDDDDDDDD